MVKEDFKMSKDLLMVLGLFSIIIVIIVFYFLRKDKLPIKLALLWLFVSFCLALLIFIPDLMIAIQRLVGFQTLSNFMIGIVIAVVLFLIMALTIIISGLRKKTTMLIQEISILKKRVRDLENEK